MRRNHINVVSLGCSKNLVDSEHLLRQLLAAGYTIEHNPVRINGDSSAFPPFEQESMQNKEIAQASAGILIFNYISTNYKYKKYFFYFCRDT